jgi:hypothetical protein
MKYILFTMVVVGLIAVLYWRGFKSNLEGFKEESYLTKGEEELYGRLGDYLNEKGKNEPARTCEERIKMMDNDIMKRAYRVDRKQQCLEIARGICEEVNPGISKNISKSFPPRRLIKTLRNMPLPTQTVLECFDTHYRCCLQSVKKDALDIFN